MGENEAGQWRRVGVLPSALAGCKSLRQSLVDGEFRLVAPAISALEIAGTRITIDARGSRNAIECKDQPR
jgi:hypothetical protein